MIEKKEWQKIDWKVKKLDYEVTEWLNWLEKKIKDLEETCEELEKNLRKENYEYDDNTDEEE